MLIIRTWSLYLFFAAVLAVVFLLGIYGYWSLDSAKGLGASEVRYRAEELLYLALVCAGVLGIALSVIILRSRRIFKELDKISDLTQHGHNHVAMNLRRLGRLGDKLAVLFHQLSILNEKKSLKISSMAGLSAFLIDNMEMRLLVLDADGKAVQCSKRLLVTQGMERKAILGRKLGEIVEGAKFQEITAELERTRKAVTVEGEGAAGVIKYKGAFIFYPIFNSAGGLVNVVCILGKDAEVDELSIKAEQIKADEGSLSSRLKGLMKGRLKR